MPVPDITDNQVQIITVSPSLGAPDVERFITFPLEQANNNIAGIKPNKEVFQIWFVGNYHRFQR